MEKDRFVSLLLNNGLHPSIANHIDESWYEIFEQLLPEIREAFIKLHTERYKNLHIVEPENIGKTIKTIYPSDTLIFRAFKLCKLTDLKVVILGQDPYHDGSAIGLAFDNKGNSVIKSPSLRNIQKELVNEGFNTSLSYKVSTGTPLGHLPEQGVLLLNTALTVEAGKPESHLEIWKPFTQKLLGILGKQEHLVWCIWGEVAPSL